MKTKPNTSDTDPTIHVGDRVAPLDLTGGRVAGRVVAIYPVDGGWPLVVWMRDARDLTITFDFATADDLQLLDRGSDKDRQATHHLLKHSLEFKDYQREHPDAEFAPATIEAKRLAMRRIELARVLQHRASELIGTPFDNPDLPGWAWADDGAASWFLCHADHAEKMLDDLYSSTLCAITSDENAAALAGEVRP